MLHEAERTPGPEDNKAVSPGHVQATPCPPPAGSHAERFEIARMIGYPASALLTYSDLERDCLRRLDWES